MLDQHPHAAAVLAAALEGAPAHAYLLHGPAGSGKRDAARDFAANRRVHVVLKGHRTIVATPAGKAFINSTGNPGMATGGTGDVLTGAMAAWIAQLRDAEAAATLAVYLHGLAGDLAAAECGEVGMIASDVVAQLGPAVLDLTGRRRTPRNP